MTNTVQIGEAVIVLTRSLKQFRLDKIEVGCGPQKLVCAMMLQGCRKADRAEVVERDHFATPNYLKSHGERNPLSPFGNTCAITPKLCMPSGQYALRKITRHSNHVPAAEQRPRHRRCPTSRDFVPWRFSDAGRHSSWIASSCRHPKTCTQPDSCAAAIAFLFDDLICAGEQHVRHVDPKRLSRLEGD